ncbi:soluble calcium-activated nucleotidase 1 [Neodiprion virginianus]|uniref:soluble calcium-activated nucleotidase 1 n=1 Tax=Neodiprion virginianus TaxID=2961670 RepID=UPI001EE769BE|nr:soluble calcium-activated nucleotidase 1 [Neodiprion virginianus]
MLHDVRVGGGTNAINHRSTSTFSNEDAAVGETTFKKKKKKKKNRREKMKSIRDWRQALRTPHVYRVGNSTFRVQSQFLLVVAAVLMVLVIFYTFPNLTSTLKYSFAHSRAPASACHYYKYNNTYPLTKSVRTKVGFSFRIAIISDLDQESRNLESKDSWYSIMKRGSLLWVPERNFISVTWDDKDIILQSSLAMKGRGMELSELVTFDGRLLTMDDRTGMIYSIEGDQVYPWVILMDGNGKNPKGFKSEWATVKDEQLYVGSMGKEWTTSAGEFVNNNPQWVKTISVLGETHSLNWVSNYKRMRQSLNIEFPGYMIHESGVWSDVHKSWFFLPRRCSEEQYNETKDESMGCNVLLTADENFLNIKVTRVGTLIPIRGFASFKFLPGSKDEIIVALKTEENQGRMATYITAFTIDGLSILSETKVSDKKFEGIEFV